MRVGSDNVGLASPVVFHYIFGTFVSGPRYQAFCDQHTQQTASMIEWKQIEISVPCPRFSWTGRFSVAAILVLTTLVAGLVYSLSPPPKRGTATLTLPEVLPLSRTGESLRISPTGPRTDLASGIRLKSAFFAYCSRQ